MMWDFTAGNRQQYAPPMGAQPMPVPERMPTPAFSIPDDMLQGPSSFPGPSYPSTPGSYPITPRSMPFPGSSAASTGYLTIPEPQFPIARAAHSEQYYREHHSSSHHRHHHRTHSNPTRPKPPVAVSSSQHHHHSHSHSHSQSQVHLAPPIPVPAPPPPRVPPRPASAAPDPYKTTGLDGAFQYSKCTGRKKALCIGINYRGQANELRGCVNDAKAMRDFLIECWGYRKKDIVLLTDEVGRSSRSIPTKQNMIEAMRWLVDGAAPNDALFFHYSGHGGQTPDKNGDEVDGWDEVIYPLDFRKRGHILDDDMHRIMVKSLPRGCRLTAVFDSCHSGTVLDLPYIYSSHGRLKGSHVRAVARKLKDTTADVISWSGCKDGQTSADTFKDGMAVGAMSHAFVSSLRVQPKQSYAQLLRSVRELLRNKYSQKPQLGSSHHIDTSLRFII